MMRLRFNAHTMTDHERDALHHQEVASLKEIIASQEGVIAQLTQHVRVLQLKVDALVKRLFGKSSEPSGAR